MLGVVPGLPLADCDEAGLDEIGVHGRFARTETMRSTHSTTPAILLPTTRGKECHGVNRTADLAGLA